MKPLLLLLAVALPAAAQTVNKCTVDGKVTYSQQPCERGQAGVVAVPEAPVPNPAAKSDLARQQNEAAKLEKARHKREAQQEREDAAASRAAGVRQRKCAKLKQDQKWAEEDARGATLQNTERTRIKAKRAADRYNLECSS